MATLLNSPDAALHNTGLRRLTRRELQAEMAIYDRLPPALRAFLMNAPMDIYAVEMRDVLDMFDVEETLTLYGEEVADWIKAYRASFDRVPNTEPAG